jgi:hypothetical protein
MGIIHVLLFLTLPIWTLWEGLVSPINWGSDLMLGIMKFFKFTSNILFSEYGNNFFKNSIYEFFNGWNNCIM